MLATKLLINKSMLAMVLLKESIPWCFISCQLSVRVKEGKLLKIQKNHSVVC